MRALRYIAAYLGIFLRWQDHAAAKRAGELAARPRRLGRP